MTFPQHTLFILPVLAASVLAALPTGSEAAEAGLDAARVRAVAAMLPEKPEGLGRPASDRAAWGRLAALPAYHDLLARAEKLLGEPLPEQPDDLFLEFSRTGNRTHWQRVAGLRRGRLPLLTLAECIENKGRFLPAIEQLVDALCAERTWMMPAHDGKLDNFYGKTIDIDLGSSALGWEMATADYLLGDRLSAKTRAQIRANLQKRILDPYRDMFTGARQPNWWMLTTNNWNAVCLAGVTGTALEQLESREERARFVAAAEKYSRNFLAGFTPDGYCSEGLGYWDYGFGHYLLLGETVRRATRGGLDLLALPEVKAPATFGARIQIIGGVAPAFADCSVRARPASTVMWLVNRRYGLGLKEYATLDPRATQGSLFEAMIYGFADDVAPGAASGAELAGLRSWFDKAGILIGRPAPGSPCRLGVALKGGNNDEHHNHNDVGSYVVVLGDRPVLVDPGAETYTARTFSSRRYESKLLNSFGHAVPVVAGTLQREGRQSAAKVLRTDFTDRADTLQLDLTSCYRVPELQKLERTWVYSREGAGSLTVTDHVALKSPQSFETALLTLGGWQRQEDGSLFLYDVDEAVRVSIDTGGRPFTLKAEEIHEDAPVVPVRIGIRLNEPVSDATVTLKITPVERPAENAGANLLRNGSFEQGTWGWDLPRNGMAAVSDERAASGKFSLKLADHSKTEGSSINSARLPVNGAGAFVLRGKVFHVAGEGIGMYVKYLDAQGGVLNQTEANGNLQPVGSLKGAPGKWEAFSYPFKAPTGTVALQLWIHSFNGSDVEAYLDDLEIARR